MATLRFLPAASLRRRGYALMNLAGHFSRNAAMAAKIFRGSRSALACGLQERAAARKNFQGVPIETPDRPERRHFTRSIAGIRDQLRGLLSESATIGSLTKKTDPWGSRAEAQSRPPWDSMILRQIANPIPV